MTWLRFRSSSSLRAVVLVWCALPLLPALAAAQGVAAPKPAGSAIVRNPADLPAPVGNRAPEVVRVLLQAEETTAILNPATGVRYRYWTFNGKVPGPMIRVRVGDTVEVTLHNPATNRMVHSIDIHASIGPGGGAALMQVPPGESRTFTFVATVPGLFVYHCGTPAVADHIANGMFGMILVEPPGGLPPVDHEYYVMQSEIYTSTPGAPGAILSLDETRLLAESPQYFVFNGALGALTTQYPLTARVGQTVRLYFGNAGPNATSSLHLVGEIFSRFFPFGSLSTPPMKWVQTVGVPPGDAAIVEVKAKMPGQFTLVDHAISRVQKGLVGFLNVTGADVSRLMYTGSQLLPSGAKAPPLAITAADAAAAQHPPSATDATLAPAAAAAGGSSQPVAMLAAGGGLTGCLSYGAILPRLTLANTAQAFRLQPAPGLLRHDPLVFARNQYARVAVAGHLVERGSSQPGAPVFVVTALRQVAASCQSAGAVAHAVSLMAVATDHVTMTDMAFVPAVIQVRVGERVEWQNTSSTIHTVVDDTSRALNAADVGLPMGAQAFDSPYLQPGQSYSRVFTHPGIYRYVCTQHEKNGMKGIVVVKPATSVIAARTVHPPR